MKYYKVIKDGYVIGIGTNGNIKVIEISFDEYTTILSIIKQKPDCKDGYDYRLKADSLEWELYELPLEDEEDPNDT